MIVMDDQSTKVSRSLSFSFPLDLYFPPFFGNWKYSKSSRPALFAILEAQEQELGCFYVVQQYVLYDGFWSSKIVEGSVGMVSMLFAWYISG